jgi:hypothetical protein
METIFDVSYEFASSFFRVGVTETVKVPHEDVQRNEGTAKCILKVSSDQLHVPAASPPRIESLVSIE